MFEIASSVSQAGYPDTLTLFPHLVVKLSPGTRAVYHSTQILCDAGDKPESFV